MSKVSKFGHPYHCEFYLFYIWKELSEQCEHWAKYFLLNAHLAHPFFIMYKKKLHFRWGKWENLGILITVNSTYFKYGKNEVNKVSIEQNIFCSMLTSTNPFFTLNKIYIYYKNKDAQICSFTHLAHPFFISYKKKTPFHMSKVSKFGHPYHCEFYLFYIWKKTKWARWALSKIFSAQCSRLLTLFLC